MRILVDHGTHANLGDLAMVESVAGRLRKDLPEASICVVDRMHVPTTIWDDPGVQRAPEYRVDVRGGRVIRRLPVLWRHADACSERVGRLMLAATGKLITAGGRRLTLPDPSDRLRAYCAAFDGLHVVGGGNLSDAFFWELFNRTLLMRAFIEAGKPVVLTGQQFGPFRSARSRHALERVLRGAAFVGVRDRGDSLALCRAAGLDADRLALMADDAIALEPEPGPATARVLDGLGVAPGQFLAVNVRRGPYAGHVDGRIEQFAILLDALHARLGLPFVVVPMTLGESDSDVVSGRELVAAVTRARVAVLSEEGLTPGRVRGVLGAARGALGVSHHFCTFALCGGVPGVCLHGGAYYGQKARALTSFWGDERLAMSLDGADLDEMLSGLLRVFDDDGLRARLRERARDATAAWRTTFDARVAAAFGRPAGSDA
jgi:polysaccharide pyruvyl transferase WcaK-like protein